MVALCLLVGLGGGCASLAKIGDTDLAWKVYTNSTYGYEVSYPREWEVTELDPESIDDFERPIVELSGETTRKHDDVHEDELIRIAVNREVSSCEDTASKTTTEIVVDGRTGVETLCFHDREKCEPQPNCYALPYAYVLHFEATDSRPSFTMLSDPTSDSFLIRHIFGTLHFTK